MRITYPPGAGGGGGTPGGADTQVQFNDGGAFGGDAGFTYVKGTDTLTLGNLVLTTALPVAQGGTGATSASSARTNLGLVIGTDVQAFNDILADLAGLTQAANKGLYFDSSTTAATFDLTAGGRALVNSAGTANTFPYFSASNTVTLGSITAAGLALLDDANAAAQLTTLGAQPLDATLTALAAYNTNGLIAQTSADNFAGRTITGTSNQISVSNGNGVSGNPTLSTPQDIHTAATPTFGGLTLSGNLTTTGNDARWVATGTGGIRHYPNGASGAHTSFETGNNATHGTDQNQHFLKLFALTDQSGTPTNYFNPDVLWGAEDASGNTASAYSWGAEGNWTNAGGFTLKRSYWWEYGADRTLLMHQSSTPDYLNVGEDAADKGLRLNIYGQTISTDSDGEIGALYSTARFTKNDTNTRTFAHHQLKPTFNFGGSNANTTVNILDIDSTNTAVTGLTANLLKASYGGTQRLRLTSDGYLGLMAGTPTARLHIVNEATGLNPTHDVYLTGSGGAGYNGRKARGTAAAPRRANTDDVLTGLAALGGQAADDSSTASFTNTAGQFRFFAAENYTASAVGAYFTLQLTPLATTGLVNRSMVAAGKALTDGSATNVLSCTIASGSAIGGVLTYTIDVTDGTDYQVETGQVVWSAVNKAGTVTATVTEVNSQQNVSSGTLTTSWAISAANPAVISVNADTSLSPSAGYPRITFNLDNNARQNVAFA